jgi:serine/threonine protein kinase
LGYWSVPDRSSSTSDRPGSDDLTRKFLAAIEDSAAADRAGAELVASIERLKSSAAECPGRRAEWMDREVWLGNSKFVLTRDCEWFTAVKTAAAIGIEESIQREKLILKTLTYPLVVRMRESLSRAVVVTEFIGNGSLTDYLPDADNEESYRLSNPTRIVRILAGIVLTVRFLHSQNIIHCNLAPENILLDWDWNVWICDFGDSISPNCPQPRRLVDKSAGQTCYALNFRYLAPECFENTFVRESDVFAFGMILCELITGRPLFSKDAQFHTVAHKRNAGNWCPNVPHNVFPAAAELIRDCLTIDYRDRPSFIDILYRLKAIRFELMAGVNSAKVVAFVEEIEVIDFI